MVVTLELLLTTYFYRLSIYILSFLEHWDMYGVFQSNASPHAYDQSYFAKKMNAPFREMWNNFLKNKSVMLL